MDHRHRRWLAVCAVRAHRARHARRLRDPDCGPGVVAEIRDASEANATFHASSERSTGGSAADARSESDIQVPTVVVSRRRVALPCDWVSIWSAALARDAAVSQARRAREPE